jgi:cell division protease FtsH
VFGEGSTGAAADLNQATRLATKMVREYGLAPEVGPVGYGGDSPMYLGTEPVRSRDYSEVTQRIIDEAIARLLTDAEVRATDMLARNRPRLDELVRLLLDHETVDGATVEAIALGPRITPDPTLTPAS